MFRMVIGGILIFLFATCSFAAQEVDVKSLDISHLTTVVQVGTTATKLPTTALSGRRVISVQNLEDDMIIYIGNSAVTADEASTGGHQLINQGDTFVADFTDDIELYGRVVRRDWLGNGDGGSLIYF